MKFSCEKSVLQSAISMTSRAVSAKSTIPALHGLLVKCDCDNLTICGYNMTVGIRTVVPVESSDVGAVVLDAAMFGNIVSKMPDDVVTVRVDSNLAATLTAGDATFNIVGIQAEDFPQLPEIEEKYTVELPEKKLRAIVQQTAFAVSTNEAIPVYTGSLFEVKGNSLTVVTMDCSRLAVRRDVLEESAHEDFSFVVPESALSECEKICEDIDSNVKITLGEKHIMFSIGQSEVICRRLEGSFLDYSSAIPKNSPISIVVDTKKILESIDRVSVVVSQKFKSPVRCTFDCDELKMSAKTTTGDARDVCRTKGDGKGLVIGFNGKFLSDAVRHAPTETVKIGLNTPTSPAVIEAADGSSSFTYLVLPVRLKA